MDTGIFTFSLGTLNLLNNVDFEWLYEYSFSPSKNWRLFPVSFTLLIVSSFIKDMVY